MRILLLSHYYPPEIGAPQQRWSALVGALAGRGHDVRVVTSAPHYPTGRLLADCSHLCPGTVHAGEHGETVYRVAFRPHNGRVRSRFADEVVTATAAVRAVRSGLGGWRPDVVVATVPSLAMLWAGRAAARGLRVPYVAEVRDAWPDLLGVADDWDDRTLHGARGRVHAAGRGAVARVGALATRLQREADAVVVTTDSFAEVLRARQVPVVHVVRNAAHPVPGYAAGPSGSADELHVLYAGTIGRAQGLATAVRAAAVAHERGVGLRLRLVGDGADRAPLQQLATDLGAPVEVLPSVPRDRLHEHYAWADTALVSLRPWGPLAYTVPSKLYELMGARLHVTAAVTGEAAGIVEGRGAGTVTPPGDVDRLASAWEELASDRRLLEVPATAGEWVREHADVAALALRYEAILDTVVASHG